jgi:hypothetical protein
LGHEVKVPVWPEDRTDMLEAQKHFFEFEKQHLPWEDWMSKYKGQAMREHFAKILWSEAILVVNEEKHGVAGYIGGNTLMELGLAFHLEKPIYLLNPIPDVRYRAEIVGMEPRVLQGDLTALS